MGIGKKASRLKADIARDLMLREITEHQMTAVIRNLRAENAALRRRGKRWMMFAAIMVVAFVAVALYTGARLV